MSVRVCSAEAERKQQEESDLAIAIMLMEDEYATASIAQAQSQGRARSSQAQSRRKWRRSERALLCPDVYRYTRQARSNEVIEANHLKRNLQVLNSW